VAGLRVVLDANVLVSGLAYATGVPGRIVEAWLSGGLSVVLSHFILDEMVRVLPRVPADRRTPDEIRDLAECFLGLARIVVPDSVVEPALRDPKDQQALGTLRVSGADYRRQQFAGVGGKVSDYCAGGFLGAAWELG